MSSHLSDGNPTDLDSLLKAALDEYTKKTGIDLAEDHFANALRDCRSAEAVILEFERVQQNAHRKTTRESGKRSEVMEKLKPVVSVVFMLCETLGEGAGLVFGPSKAIFCGFKVLLQAAQDVSASYSALVKLFDSFAEFLERLKFYVEPPRNMPIPKIIVKTMAEMLSVVALATKHIKRGWLKNFLKTLLGNKLKEILDALEKLDRLTNEELRMVVAQIHKDAAGTRQDVQRILTEQEAKKREELQAKLWAWLSPPNVSANHDFARERHHPGTARWFLQGTIFEDWKRDGSLLWIRGKPGSGKTILSYTIIENLFGLSTQGGAMVAYFYFSFQDSGKRNLRDLLSSLIIQFSLKSDACGDVLSQLYGSARRDSSDTPHIPSNSALVGCLTQMLKLLERTPTYIIIDALDESPTSGSASGSPRTEVLKFIVELVGSRIHGLRVCATSRPEDDIRIALEALATRHMILERQPGQADDIDGYIRSTVESNDKMKKWSKAIRDEVFDALSSNANGMFRYVSCQLDTLCKCPPVAVRSFLKSLPRTLQGTYEDTLSRIDDESWKYAHRIFQCLSFSTRPPRVSELAEVLAVDFDSPIPVFDEELRIFNAEEAVLSTCPGSFIAIVGRGRRKVVQFAHFSVKEFLTSNYVSESEDKNVRRFRVLAEPAHTALAQACLGILLRFDTHVDKTSIENFPLALYAAEYWPEHARSGDASQSVLDAMKTLFDPSMPYFKTWIWLYDHDAPRDPFHWRRQIVPPQPNQSPLYYATRCGITQITDYLINSHPEDVNVSGGHYGTCLHAASSLGHTEVVRALLKHGADASAQDTSSQTSLHYASRKGHPGVVQLLLLHGADANARDKTSETPLHDGSRWGHFDVVHLLLEHHADTNARTGNYSETPLHQTLRAGHLELVQLLLKYGADVNAQDGSSVTPLHIASSRGHPDITRLLLDNHADVNARSHDSSTPLHLASNDGHLVVVQLLLDHHADINARDNASRTPFHRALDSGHFDTLQLLLEHGADANSKGGGSDRPLHLASRKGYLRAVQLLIEHNADVNARFDDASNTPLHEALDSRNVDIAQLLLEHGADVNAQNGSSETPLHRASGQGRLNVAQLLLKHHADTNARDGSSQGPLHRASSKGHLNISRLLLEHGSDVDLRDGSSETPLHYASKRGDLGIARLLVEYHADFNARGVGSGTPIHRASQSGSFDVVKWLLEHGADVNSRDGKSRTPLHYASRSGHPKVVRRLLEHGADVHAKDVSNKTALDLVSKRNPKIAELLMLSVAAAIPRTTVVAH